MTDDTTLILVEASLTDEQKPINHLQNRRQLYRRVRGLIVSVPWPKSGFCKLARSRGVGLSPSQVRDMVARAMVPAERGMVVDQFQLAQALKALAVLDEVSDDAIATVLPAAMHDVLFDLITFAANREEARGSARRSRTCGSTKIRIECFRCLLPSGLVSSQWQLVMAHLIPATELSIHPFVAGKLQRLASHFTRQQLHDLTRLAADIDAGMETFAICAMGRHRSFHSRYCASSLTKNIPAHGRG